MDASDGSQIEQFHDADELESQPIDEKQTTITNG